MTDRTVRVSENSPEEPVPERTAPESAVESSIAPDDPAGAPEKEMAELRQENAGLKDRLLRALAEMENLRRRTEREVVDARTYGIASFARDVLTVADNMRRALDAVGQGPRASADPATTAFLEGVELTERELQKILEKHGVTRLDPAGQKFDPNMHQAMYEVPDPSIPAGTVVEVVQPGYRLGERVLRPAMVAVAKGGPKPPQREVPANDNADADPPPEPA
jgi:molecular chaperone GrpE